MTDQIELFKDVCSSPLLASSHMILFLNKKDLFEEKIKAGARISEYFPDYIPDEEVSETRHAGRFFRDLFLSHSNGKKTYVHFTCGTDSAHMKVIISAVRDIVTRQALISSGIY